MNGGQATVLVVDDTPENIDLLVEILKGDYKVKAARNGQQGLKIARLASAPDLILLDIMMPDIDGFEVARQLKEDPTTCDIPIIFVTAKISTEDEIQGFKLGALDYIRKPLNPAEFKIVVRRALDQVRLAEENKELKSSLKLYDVSSRISKTIEIEFSRDVDIRDATFAVTVTRPSGKKAQLELPVLIKPPSAIGDTVTLELGNVTVLNSRYSVRVQGVRARSGQSEVTDATNPKGKVAIRSFMGDVNIRRECVR